MNRDHFLHGFLNPKSVAIYGANNKGNSLASLQVMNLIKSSYDGKVYPIHLNLESVMGFKAYKSISEAPEIPDLVVIVLPAKIVPQIFKECGEKGECPKSARPKAARTIDIVEVKPDATRTTETKVEL